MYSYRFTICTAIDWQYTCTLPSKLEAENISPVYDKKYGNLDNGYGIDCGKDNAVPI